MRMKNRQTLKWLRQRSLGDHLGGSQITTETMQRLGHESSLEGHTSCVNCLEWNKEGGLLASGSDDCNVIVWDPFRGRAKDVIQTGHEGNIFSVKFLPATGDHQIASCSSEKSIKINNLLNKERVFNCTTCHKDSVKRLAVHQHQPNLLWSASDDGSVMQFDLRESHKCETNDYTPKNTLINLKSCSPATEAKCLDLNPLRDEMIAVGANDIYVRLFDRRYISNSHSASSAITDYFAPGHLMQKPYQKPSCQLFGTTYLTFSPDGSELLANVHAEQIYLYKTYEHQEGYKSFETTMRPLVLGQTLRSSPTIETGPKCNVRRRPHDPWFRLKALYERNRKLPQKHREFCDALTAKLKYNEKFNMQELNQLNKLLSSMEDCAKLYRLRAAGLLRRGWRGDSYQSLRDCCCALALKPADEKTVKVLAEVACQLDDKDLVKGLIELVSLGESRLDWDLGETSNLLVSKYRSGCRQRRSTYSPVRSWLESRFSSVYREEENDEDLAAMLSSLHSSGGSSEFSADSQDAESSTREEIGSPQMDSPSEDLLSDTEAHAPRIAHQGYESLSRSIYPEATKWRLGEFPRTAAAHDFARRFCGHCHMNTDIKEANFFGYNGEFVVGGSDDGAFYIWHKDTTNIVKAINGDVQILNCLQPHPSICMLATSGIEPSIKLWSPTGRECRDVWTLERRCSQNQEFINSDPLEAMIMLLTHRDT